MTMTRGNIPADELEAKIAELLNVFFTRRAEKLGELKLKNQLKAKSPYLMRAIGVADASEIVEEMLDAHISSSDETIFGNDFFEPLAKWVAEKAYKGIPGTTVQVSGAEGCDVSIEHQGHYEAFAVKSGPKVFNAQSKKKQSDEFKKLKRILAKTKKVFEPIVGYCYGNKQQRESATTEFKEIAGQRFWSHLTGDDSFYLRISELMRESPIAHRQEFQMAYTQAKNKFVKEFSEEFTTPDGLIDWDKLTKMNSGIPEPKPKNDKPKILKKTVVKDAQSSAG